MEDLFNTGASRFYTADGKEISEAEYIALTKKLTGAAQEPAAETAATAAEVKGGKRK